MSPNDLAPSYPAVASTSVQRNLHDALDREPPALPHGRQHEHQPAEAALLVRHGPRVLRPDHRGRGGGPDARVAPVRSAALGHGLDVRPFGLERVSIPAETVVGGERVLMYVASRVVV